MHYTQSHNSVNNPPPCHFRVPTLCHETEWRCHHKNRKTFCWKKTPPYLHPRSTIPPCKHNYTDVSHRCVSHSLASIYRLPFLTETILFGWQQRCYGHWISLVPVATRRKALLVEFTAGLLPSSLVPPAFAIWLAATRHAVVESEESGLSLIHFTLHCIVFVVLVAAAHPNVHWYIASAIYPLGRTRSPNTPLARFGVAMLTIGRT